MDRATQVEAHAVYSTALATAAVDYFIASKGAQENLPVPWNVRVPSGCVTALRSSTGLPDRHCLENTLGALMGFIFELSFVFEIVVFTARGAL